MDCTRVNRILEAFAPRLIEVLEARMAACRKKLLDHISEAFTPTEGIICWTRKDGSADHYSQASFDAMEAAVKCLKKSGADFKYAPLAVVDQTLKALLNMPELDHSDMGGFTFAELVSVLCELHANPLPSETPVSEYFKLHK